MEQLIIRIEGLKKQLDSSQEQIDNEMTPAYNEIKERSSETQTELADHERRYRENDDLKFSIKESLMDVIKTIDGFDAVLRNYEATCKTKVEDMVQLHATQVGNIYKKRKEKKERKKEKKLNRMYYIL
jgi:hypothetical protein